MNINNLTALTLSVEQLAAIDTAYATMQANLTGLVARGAGQKRNGRVMGPRTEPFCRLALETMQKHPQLLPPSIPVAEAVALLQTFDQLRPRVRNLIELLTRADDTLFSLGGDIYAVALEGYNQLRRLGSIAGLKPTVDELSLRFARSRAFKERRAANDSDRNTPDRAVA